jgi:ectoine hydroxylase-related dioxygenase (phytanoyl-CoA dioxygenase family)
MTNVNNNELHQLSEHYNINGFVGPINILSEQEANDVWIEFRRWVCDEGPEEKHQQQQLEGGDEITSRCQSTNGEELNKSEEYFVRCLHTITGPKRFKPHLYVPCINQIVQNPKLVRIVRSLLQTNHIAVWSSDFNIKFPGTLSYYAPHQDSTYAGLHPANKCCTVWVALSDPVTVRDGCLGFWPASHRHGQIRHVECIDDTDNVLSRRQRIDGSTSTKSSMMSIGSVATNDARTTATKTASTSVTTATSSATVPERAIQFVPLRRGEATIHNFFTIHESGPNESNQPRVGLAIRYIAVHEVQQVGQIRESVTYIPFNGVVADGDKDNDNDRGGNENDDTCTVHNNDIPSQQGVDVIGFHYEPILPLEKNMITILDIERGIAAHRDSIHREAINYFNGSLLSTKMYDSS